MRTRCLLFLMMIFLHISQSAHAENKTISLELQNANLSDAVRLVAQALHLNVIMSPTIQGVATLHLSHALPQSAFDLLLAAHGLGKWRSGNVWYIAPRDELIKRKEQEQKWQQIADDTAPLTMQFWQIHYAKAQDLAHLLKDEHASLLSKRGSVHADARTNGIYIQDTQEKMQALRRLIKQLDVPVQQIAIEARLASVDSDCERELGISFAVMHENEHNREGKHWLPQEIGRYSLAVAKLADGSLLDVKLSALEMTGQAELISHPSLFTANQQPASIEAGEEVPYQEVSESGGTAVVFKKAVLGLKVTPQILPGNKVLLQLKINQDRPSARMVQGMPTISTRQITTNVLVKNGQTIVLGGIYETNRENGEQRLPFISQVPLIGALFKRQNKRENKRELLIFVTPRIIA